ncbi:MAG: N-methyl-L-tryptophan oxidase [Pseudomonadota bacterium]
MATPRSYKLIIVGAYGLVSSSAFYQAAKLAKESASANSQFYQQPQVLAIDQFSLGHAEGSSHGESRITRLAIGEGAEYVELAKRSHEIWKEVESQTDSKLLHVMPDVPIGGLIVGPDGSGVPAFYHGTEGFLQQTHQRAREYKVKHQYLANAALRQTFPQFKFRDGEAGYCEESMGYINADACIKANIALAKKFGGELRDNEIVERFEKLADGKIKVTTSKKSVETSYLTEKLIIAAGPWLQNLVDVHELTVCRQVVYWFKVDPASRSQFTNASFPTFIWNLDNKNMVYGFPLMEDAEAIKIGTESYATTTTPETVDRQVSQIEITRMYEKFIKPYFTGITSECVKAKVCLYTVAPKWRFVIDFLPDYDNKVIVASPCSGHGAKHAAAVGEAIAQQSLRGKSKIPVMEFGGLLLPDNRIRLTRS